MTFSIVARCADTGRFGMAICSSSPAVAARCAHVRAGVGAAASQNITDPTLGTKALDLLECGAGAAKAMEVLLRGGPSLDYRQLLIVDRQGESAAYSGAKALGVWNHVKAPNVACGGNLLAQTYVPLAMLEGFLDASGHLCDRLLGALRAALEAGGEAGPVHSAGVKIVDQVPWPIIDLRVDWTENCPIAELDALWTIYRTQVDAYVTRALAPEKSESYGVPGDP